MSSGAVPDAYVALASRVAAEGVAVARSMDSAAGFETKDDGSPVTAVDRAVERAMRDMIAREAPGHGVLGEEFSGEDHSAEWTWVLDPIDGTRQFAAGLLNFAVLVALCHQDHPVVGIIAHPFAGRTWMGIDGQGTTLNGRPVATLREARLGDVVACLANPESFPGEWGRGYEAIGNASRWNVHDGGCIGYGALSEGRIGLCLNGPNLDPFDIAALVPVVEGAGGVITGWRGEQLTLASHGAIVASANRALHDEALNLLA